MEFELCGPSALFGIFNVCFVLCPIRSFIKDPSRLHLLFTHEWDFHLQLTLHSLMIQTDCSEKAQELEQQGWNWVCCRGGDFGTSEAQKPFEFAWILRWRPRTLDSLWLYAKPEHTLSTSWTARSGMQSELGKKNEDCHRFCRRDCVSLTTSFYPCSSNCSNLDI